jgi:hypothetical protein
MTDHPKPRFMQVPCYNMSEGCSNTVSYMGIKPLRKICQTCKDSGTPSERYQVGFNFGKAMRKVRAEAMAGLDLGGQVCYEVTVWPKTIFGGRVTPCRTEG